MVAGYRAARASYVEDRERVTLGYETEIAEYNEAHNGGVTFKNWLCWNKGSGDEYAS
jgi:hypothetical protein